MHKRWTQLSDCFAVILDVIGTQVVRICCCVVLICFLLCYFALREVLLCCIVCYCVQLLSLLLSLLLLNHCRALRAVEWRTTPGTRATELSCSLVRLSLFCHFHFTSTLCLSPAFFSLVLLLSSSVWTTQRHKPPVATLQSVKQSEKQTIKQSSERRSRQEDRQGSSCRHTENRHACTSLLLYTRWGSPVLRWGSPVLF